MDSDRARAQETDEDRDNKAAIWVKAKCEIASIYVAGLSDSDPQKRQYERAQYQHHRDEAIASARAIKDEFYQGFAIHHVITLCRTARDLDTARTLFKEVDDDFLRDQILKDAPELAGEKKGRLSDEEKARSAVTINLDGLDREAVIRRVVKAMRDLGTPKRELEGFNEDAVNADYATMLAKAIGWGSASALSEKWRTVGKR
jgi:hypothetical protein